MKLSRVSSFAIPRFSLRFRRNFAEAPHDGGTPRNIVATFIAGVRARYDARNKNKPPSDRRLRLSPIYFLAAGSVALLLSSLLGRPHAEVISYSQFKSLLKKGLVAEVVIGETALEGNLKSGAATEIFTPEKLKGISPETSVEKTSLPFVAVRVEDPYLTAELEAANVPFKGHVSSNWLPTILSWVVPVGLFFLMWSYLGKKMGSGSGGLMQIGKSKAKVYIEKKTGVTFADVAGLDEAEE